MLRLAGSGPPISAELSNDLLGCVLCISIISSRVMVSFPSHEINLNAKIKVKILSSQLIRKAVLNGPATLWSQLHLLISKGFLHL